MFCFHKQALNWPQPFCRKRLEKHRFSEFGSGLLSCLTSSCLSLQEKKTSYTCFRRCNGDVLLTYFLSVYGSSLFQAEIKIVWQYDVPMQMRFLVDTCKICIELKLHGCRCYVHHPSSRVAISPYFWDTRNFLLRSRLCQFLTVAGISLAQLVVYVDVQSAHPHHPV